MRGDFPYRRKTRDPAAILRPRLYIFHRDPLNGNTCENPFPPVPGRCRQSSVILHRTPNSCCSNDPPKRKEEKRPAMVKYCQSCGAKITHDTSSSLCHKCEAKRLASIDPRGYMEIKQVCPHCRADLEKQVSKKTCMKCGKSLSPRWGLIIITLIGMSLLLLFLWGIMSRWHTLF